MASKKKETAGASTLYEESIERGYFGSGSADKDRSTFTVSGKAGATDVADDRAAANTGDGAGKPEPGTGDGDGDGGQG